MDELVSHCLREISFDGDLGCDISRLRDFITNFCARRQIPQVVDDAYLAFVWSLIVGQPTVRVGTIPPGTTTEVYIAPQVSKKRKAKAENEDALEEPIPATELSIISNAAKMTLEELVAAHGDELRISVDPETAFAAITGSHTRPAKLSPMVYTALQLIARARADGISVVDIGRKTGYDQKSCFYLIKQLLELDLVVKLRRGGVGANFCVLKYFFDHDPLWQQIEEEGVQSPEAPPEQEDQGEPNENDPSKATVQFDPIDARHLSSLPLIQSRIVKLLRNSDYYIHPSQNLLLTIGFSNPTKSDRRFFQIRLRELVDKGIIEKILVPNSNKRVADSKVPCIRLVTDADVAGNPAGAHPVVQEDNAIEQDLIEGAAVGGPSGLKVNVTLHKQMIDLLEAAGPTGMTLNELSDALGNFDRRTLELLLTRLERFMPPSHLHDLGVAQMMENFGRERRYRYYTIASYRVVDASEDLKGPYADVYLADVGAFVPVDPAGFYVDVEELDKYVDNFKLTEDQAAKKSKKAAAGGKKQKKAVVGEDGAATPVKQGKKRKRGESEGVEGIEGTAEAVDGDDMAEPPPKKKRGRPRKVPIIEQAIIPSTDDVDELFSDSQIVRPVSGRSAPPPPKKKLGRPRKHPIVEPELGPDGEPIVPPKKKRGRPRKIEPADEEQTADGQNAVDGQAAAGGENAAPVVPRKRGRPRKSVVPPPDAESATAAPEPLQAMDIDIPPAESSAFLAQDTQPLPVLPQIPLLQETAPGLEPKPPDAVVPAIPSTMDRTATSAVVASSARRSARKTKAVVRPDFVLSSKPKKGTTTTLQKAMPETAKHDTPSNQDLPVIVPEFEFPSAANAILPETEQQPVLPVIEHLRGAGNMESNVAVKTIGLRTEVDIPIDPSLLSSEGPVEPSSTQVAISQQSSSMPAVSEQSPSQENKRAASESATPQPAQKRQKTDASKRTPRPKGNVSLLRRENELIRVLENLEGIGNTSSKEFLDAHLALLDKMAEAGEQTSGPPGVRVDKRTLDSTLDSMERSGKVKILKTSITLLTGSQRQVRLAYLPTVEQAQLSAFLVQVGRMAPRAAPMLTPLRTVIIDVPEGTKAKAAQVPPPQLRLLQMDKPADGLEHWNKNKERADQLFGYDENTIHDMLLTEKTTISQFYGFILGKALRARELHLASLAALTGNNTPSAFVVSSEKRILHSLFYSHDLPVGTYCAIVSALVHDDELTQLWATEEGRRTPMKDLSQTIQNTLQIGRSRARARLNDLLGLLGDLGVATPLQPSVDECPAIQCVPNNDHPTAFDIYQAPLDTTGVTVGPMYWQFNSDAPLFLWALSENPPYWKTVPIGSHEEAVAFWQDLQKTSQERTFAQGVECPTAEGLPLANTGSMVTLRRPASWRSDYELTWYQRRYLRQFITSLDGTVPLQGGESDRATMARLCSVVSAPLHVVEEFLTNSRRKQKAEIDKVRARKKEKIAEERYKRLAEEKSLLTQKAASARAQREQDWQDLLLRVHPDPLKGSAATRVKRVCTRYLQSGASGDVEHWEFEIQQAIKEAKVANQQFLGSVQRTALPRNFAAVPVPVTTGTTGKTVEELIEGQRPLQQAEKPAKKRRRGKTDDQDKEAEIEKTPARRHRFQWNADYDELAQDACVILRARARDLARMDWSALEQVFPGVPRNSVRQRFAAQRELPGTETYLKRLEDRWYSLWVQHRGTEHLPDDDPRSLNNFDLVAHVQFLRLHVDKNALRVGSGQPHESAAVTLPADISQIEAMWVVSRKAPQAPLWDFMWNLAVEEGREKASLSNAFTTDVEDISPTFDTCSDSVRIAESALKMVFGTPNEHYDSTKASTLLQSAGEQTISLAKTNLISRSVLSKLVRDPHKPKPGRTLKISELNQNAIGGSIPRDTFQDASALDFLSREQEAAWREWPLLASDGDLAMLVQSSSDGKVNFKVDTTQAGAARPGLDWNSKKADDDHIETKILVSFLDVLETPETEEPTPSLPSPTPAVEGEDIEWHGRTLQGAVACCRKLSDGFVDCRDCLDAEKAVLIARLDPQGQETCHRILTVLQEVGSKGLTRRHLMDRLEGQDPDAVIEMLEQLVDTAIPLVLLTGYSTLVFVSAHYARSWTVAVAEDPCTLVLPRRWLDISGLKIAEIWEAALRAVIGTIVFRPGISQSEIRWRLRSVYDRQEVADVLRHLSEEGFIKLRLGRGSEEGGGAALPLDDMEEKETYWFLGERRWYQTEVKEAVPLSS